MTMQFVKATKKQARLRMSLAGASGSGKTFSALSIGRALVGDGKIALLDTERGSASKYSDKFEFDTCEVYDNYHPERLFEAIDGAAAAGYELLIVDSLSHFWNGPGGILELVDEEVKKQKARGNKPDSFAAWKGGDKIFKTMVQKIVGAPLHLILTMRAKQEFVKEADERGKTTVRKVGMAPEMRDSFIYEADVEGMIDAEHNLVIGKTRCDGLDGKVFTKPGKDVAAILKAWLSDGEPMAAPRVAVAPAPSASQNAQVIADIHEVLGGQVVPAAEPIRKVDLEADILAEECRQLFEAAASRAEVEAASAKAGPLDKARKMVLKPIREAALRRTEAA